jgi:hypothetical protein
LISLRRNGFGVDSALAEDRLGKAPRQGAAEGFNHRKLVNLCVVALAFKPIRYSTSILVINGKPWLGDSP